MKATILYAKTNAVNFNKLTHAFQKIKNKNAEDRIKMTYKIT